MVAIVVGTAAQLSSALRTAKGGDTIVLKAGNYGELFLQDKTNFASTVKIVSQDVDNPGVFSGIDFRNVSNVSFESVKFDYEAASGAAVWKTPFLIRGGKNISITKSTFDGDDAAGLSASENGYGTGTGLYVTASSGITIANNKMFNFHRGLAVTKSNNIDVSGNELTDMSKDGMNFQEVVDIDIARNYIHDFHRSASSTVHADMIQFMSPNAKVASSDVRITENLLDAGNGSLTQSLFIRNEAVDSYGGGKAMFYKNFLIANNIIRNGHSHGVTVGETDGLVIQNNTVMANVLGQLRYNPSINVNDKSLNVTVLKNLVSAITVAAKAGWIVDQNYLLQHKNAVGDDYIGNIFADPFDRFDVTLNDFRLLPGSIADKLGVGSGLSKPLGTPSGFILSDNAEASNGLVQEFDATNVIAAGGKINLTGAKVTWNYGDGTTGTGFVAEHAYTKAGIYTATVKITLADGKVVVADKTIILKNSNILDMDFQTGIVDTSSNVNDVLAGTKAKMVTLADGKKVLDLNGGFVTVKADSEFFNNTDYTFVADFKKDATAAGKIGRLAYFNGSLIVSVKDDGLEAIVRTNEGTKILTANNLGIKDTDWHRLGVTFSGETGFAKLYLDGVQVATIAGLEGEFQQGTRAANFIIGGPYGNSFDGKIDNVHFFGEALPGTALKPGSGFLAAAKANIADTTARLSDAAALIETSPVEAFATARSATPEATTSLDDADGASASLISGLLDFNNQLPDADFRLI